VARPRTAPEDTSEAFVQRLHRQVDAFARGAGVRKAFVSIELDDGSRFVVDGVAPEPGFGFVTLRLHRRQDDDPEALIVPLRVVRRIELDRAEDQRAPFGFGAGG
jgi:hypothetical protein